MSVTLVDGRRLSWAEYGSAGGAPLVMLHGTPGSRLQFQWMHGLAAAAGIRVIAPERPGYGASDPVPEGISFPRYADDLLQLLDHLELPIVTLCGASGGGGFALAAAIVHPERVELTIDTEVHPPKMLLIRGRAELDVVDGIPDEYLQMNGSYEMTPEQRIEWEAEVRSLYDGMVRIVVTPTWAKLIDFETTLPTAVEELIRQRAERQHA